jgi:predicted dehydrogenase
MVRLGIIGAGNMGTMHIGSVLNGKAGNCTLAAVCEGNPERRASLKDRLPQSVQIYDDPRDLMISGKIDAVLIATPHISHPPLAIEAFSNGLHVLTEKPAGVYTKQVREMNEAAVESGRVFAIMFNQRTNPLYTAVKRLIANGELGQIMRFNWIITDWYRTQKYFNSGGWRGTWSGEGGGVLLNQDPHQLDLIQWLCGMPKRVRAFCGFGRYHEIEVEDDVTAYLEYENGATGVFVSSTGEYPGTNRLEIVGDKGKIVVEEGKLYFNQLKTPLSYHTKNAPDPFSGPECWACQVPVTEENTQHAGILKNFTEAILNGIPLLAPGIEGINSLSISNAIYLSTFTDAWVELPVDEELFYRLLKERIEKSNYRKPEVSKSTVVDLSGTY